MKDTPSNKKSIKVETLFSGSFLNMHLSPPSGMNQSGPALAVTHIPPETKNVYLVAYGDSTGWLRDQLGHPGAKWTCEGPHRPHFSKKPRYIR